MLDQPFMIMADKEGKVAYRPREDITPYDLARLVGLFTGYLVSGIKYGQVYIRWREFLKSEGLEKHFLFVPWKEGEYDV